METGKERAKRAKFEEDFPKVHHEMRLYALEVLGDIRKKCFEDEPLIDTIRR